MPTSKDSTTDADSTDADTGDTGDGDTGGSSSGATDTGGDTGKTYTATEVDALLAKARGTATSAAKRDLLADLGFEKADDAKSFVDAKRQAELEAMNEVDRAKAEAADAMAEAARLKSEANEESLRARVATSLVTGPNGCRPERVGIATENALLQSLRAPEGTDDVVAYGIDAVRESSPEWFAAETTSDDTGTGPKTGSGSTTPPPPGRTSGTSKPPGNDEAKKAAESWEAWRAKNKRPDVLSRLNKE